MAAELTASMKLQLDDLLSAPLRKVEELLKRIGEIGKVASIDKLTSSMQPLREGANLAQTVVEKVTRIGAAAMEATAPITEMTRAIAETATGATAATEAAEAIARVGTEAMESTGRVEALIARMRGMATAGIGAAGGAIRGAGGVVRETGGRLREAGNAAGELGGAVLGAGMTGIGLYEPVHMAAEMDQVLRQIAITKGLSGALVAPEIARLQTLFNADARRSGQTSMSIAEAYFDLLGQGLPSALLDKTIGIHSMAATAYGIDAETLGKPVGALLGQLGINEQSLPGALASMAAASKSGLFKVKDFAGELSGVSGQAALIGLSGRKGVDELFAILETVMKNTGMPSSAAADVNDMIGYIFSDREDRRMAKLLHVNLPKYLVNEKKVGVNAVDAFLRLIHKRTTGMDGQQLLAFLTPLIMNQQARTAVIALLQHNDFRKNLQGNLDAVPDATLGRDAATANQGMQPNLNRTIENTTQLGRRFGTAFYPIILRLNTGLGSTLDLIQRIDKAHPSAFNWTIGGLGTLVAAGTGLSILGHGIKFLMAGIRVFGPLMSGLNLAFLAGRLGLLALGFEGLAGSALAAGAVFLLIPAAIAAVGLAAYEIYEHWNAIGAWFKRLWDGILDTINGAVRALRDFNGATPNVTGQGGGRGSVHGPPPASQVDVHLHVTTDHPNTKVAVTDTRVTSAPNRGLVLGRP